jgi:hypothetical protein
MQIENPARLRETLPLVGSGELAESLTLVRASTLKMIRLQLAMERNDRRVALETVDELVAIDRRLQDCIAEVPVAGEQLMFRQAVDADRALLNREKMTLAAEIVRPGRLAERAPSAEIIAPVADAWEEFDFVADEDHRPHRAILWLALALALLAAAAGGLWIGIGPERLIAVGTEAGLVQ